MFGMGVMPARSVVEEKARTADLHDVRERVTLTCQGLVQPGQQPGEFVPLGGAVALRKAGEHLFDGFAVHIPKGSRPGPARGGLIGEGLGTGVEQIGEAAHGGGFRRDQRRAADLGLVQEQLDDATAGAPSRKDDGGRAEVGHAPLDVVPDEVSRGRGQRRVVPAEKHRFDRVCQG